MKKILLIDDEKDFCQLIKEQLELSSAFQVETCSNARDAVNKVREMRPDLIFLDIMMPAISGPEIAAELKASEETKKIPIVFLTAVIGEEEAKSREHLIGGERFLGKPVKIEELLYMVNRLIG